MLKATKTRRNKLKTSEKVETSQSKDQKTAKTSQTS